MTASRQRQSLGSVTCPMKAVTLDLSWARGVGVRVVLVWCEPDGGDQPRMPCGGGL
jgi:hypothetical protein